MAGKKKGGHSGSKQHHQPKSTNGKQQQQANGKQQTNGKHTNGKHTNGKHATNGHSKKKTSGSTGSVPLLVCVVVGLLSLTCGLLSPHLLKAWRDNDQPTTNISRNLSSSSKESSTKKKPSKNRKNKRQQERADKRKMAEMLGPKHEFACDKEALSKVLHEEPVPGMHVICMDQTMKSLKLTMFPGAQRLEQPVVEEMEGLPEWVAFKAVLQHHLNVRRMDNLHQPWGLFSPDGELLLKEDNEHVQMDGLVQMGMIMLFQGGQFIWPGVKIGFKRTIDLYSVMPGGSPSFGDKHRTATLETISLKPLVFSVEGFLDEEECDFFQREAKPTLKYSEVTLMDMDKGRPASDFRTSQSTFLQNNNHDMIRDIDYRTASLVRVPRFHQENVQVLRYGGGEKYDAHHDYFDKKLYKNDISTLKNFIQYGRRNRMITVFWYLSDVEEGGETVFPRFGGAPPPRNMSDCHIGLKVKPVRGKVIIFYSLKPDGSLDPLSLHGACPVIKGVKWAANKWVWNLPIEFGSGR